jgi:hypothetical protein
MAADTHAAVLVSQGLPCAACGAEELHSGNDQA